MTVRVQRTFDFDVSSERVWEFIADPEKRARAISVVTEYEVTDPDEHRATWHVKLPIPLIDSTVTVDTQDVEREPPRYVKFVGRSRAMRVTGEHTIEETETGCRLHNEFVVDGKLPGVERFFKRHLDAELENIEAEMREDLGLRA